MEGLSHRKIYAIFTFVCYICKTSIIFPLCKWSHFCWFPCNTVPCSFLLIKSQKEKQFVRVTEKWLLICVHYSNLTQKEALVSFTSPNSQWVSSNPDLKKITSTNSIIKILIQHRLIEKSDFLLSLLERREISEHNDSLSTIWGLHLGREH